MSIKTRRLGNIDGLRAIAALSVYVFHQFTASLTASMRGTEFYKFADYIVHSFDVGRFGVVLFFLISGFVIPFSIKGNRPITQFSISRVFRLYPAFWAAIAIVCLERWLRSTPVDLNVILANITMVPNLMRQPLLNGVYWTLFIELLFYFGCATMFFLGILRAPVAIFLTSLGLIAITAIPAVANTVVDAGFPVTYIGLHLATLILGLLLRMAILEKSGVAGFLSTIAAFTLLIAVWAASDYSLSAGKDDGFSITPSWSLILCYAAAIAIFVLCAMFNLPRSRTLSFLGRISYSIYLVHWSIFVVVLHFFPFIGSVQDLFPVAISVVATVVTATAMFYFIELPGIDVGKKIIPNGRAPSTTVA